jgi:hypothetical protein
MFPKTNFQCSGFSYLHICIVLMLLLVRVTLAIIGRFQFGAQVARAPPITDPFPSSFGALCPAVAMHCALRFAVFTLGLELAEVVLSSPLGWRVSDYSLRYIEQLPADEYLRLESNLAKCAENKGLPWGSACSGVDAIVHWLPSLLRSMPSTLLSSFDATAIFKHEFSCESSAKKIFFMRQNKVMDNCGALFKDVQKLTEARVLDELSGRLTHVLWTCIFVAGFVCKSVSCCNQHRRGPGSLKKKKGETSATFWGCYGYIKKHMTSACCKRSWLHVYDKNKKKEETTCIKLPCIGKTKPEGR